jgi:hypothetical protein
MVSCQCDREKKKKNVVQKLEISTLIMNYTFIILCH